jgi:hypothetical protein
MRSLGLEPDPWQIEVLEAGHPRLLLNCCRQAGKSTAVAILGLAEAIFVPFSKVLLLSRSHRQSAELFRTLVGFYRQLNTPLLERLTTEQLELANRSRIVCLPCREDTVRGYAHVNLLVIDEAARVPDDLYRAVRPMLAVSGGRLVCLSTPYGRRGFFYEAWAKGGTDWQRIEVPAERVARIPREFLAQERRCLGESWYRQEYCCSFEALEGLVYPDFNRCVVPGPAPAAGLRVGGIDFGFRNPFAALWGVLDQDSILWLTGEHYQRYQPLREHIRHMPPEVMWYCDPSGAQERCELICAGLKVRTGHNALSLGIAAVTTRLREGTLRVVQGCCPNLSYEAGLYRYEDTSDRGGSESPLDEHNHALAALRYLVTSLDWHHLARGRRPAPFREAVPAPGPSPLSRPSRPLFRSHSDLWNDPHVWTEPG